MPLKLGYGLTAALALSLELDRWRKLGVRPRLWWRDDDAREPTPALDRLIVISAGRPLALAVVPDGRLLALAHALSPHQNVSVGQHGIDHKNRSVEEVRSEYGRHTSKSDMQTAIGVARGRLTEAGLAPVFFTPPWNACQAELGEAVANLGYDYLSAGNQPPPELAISYLATDVDLIRWKDAPRFRGARKALSALHKALRDRRVAERLSDPIGLLTHHLDHDEPTWRFLAWFLPFADRRFDWVGAASSE